MKENQYSLNPINGYVIVKKIDLDKEGGILMPDVNTEKAIKCEVVAIDKSDKDINIQVGDIVVIKRFDAVPFKCDENEEECYIIHKSLIFSKLENNSEKNISENQKNEKKLLFD